MIPREHLCVNHLLIVTFVRFWIWKTCCFTNADLWGLMKFEWKREAACLCCTPAVPAQLALNNWETIWLCLDGGFVEFGSKPIWLSWGSREFVPVNCNYSNDATGYSSFPVAPSAALVGVRLCTVLSPHYRPVSLIVRSLYPGVDECITGCVEINNPVRKHWPEHQKCSDADEHGQRCQRWRKAGRGRGGGRRDGIKADSALLCFILCLRRISSYLTCALLNSPLHQVQPVFASDS